MEPKFVFRAEKVLEVEETCEVSDGPGEIVDRAMMAPSTAPAAKTKASAKKVLPFIVPLDCLGN